MKQKHIFYILIFTISFFINMFYVQAKCSTEQYNNYRSLANQVKITYKYLEELEKKEEPQYGVFEVTISGLTPEIYVYDDETYKEYYYKSNEIITFNTHGGQRTFSIMLNSSECGNYLIKKLTIDIPVFNSYAIKDYCKGIDTKEFPMCDKWYQFDVTYKSLTEALDSYKKRTTTKVNLDDNSNTPDKNENIIDFLMNNQIYLVIGLSVIFVVLMTIAIIARRKRGALE